MNSYFNQLKGLSPSQIDLMLRVQYNSSVTIRGSEIRTGKSLERKGLGKVRAVRGSDLHEFMDAETWAPVKAVLDEKNRQYNAWIDAGNDHSDFPGYVGIEGG